METRENDMLSENTLAAAERKASFFYRGADYHLDAEVEEEEAEEETPDKEEWGEGRRPEEKHWFTAIQIAACVLILLAFLILKAVGGAVYESVRDWYVSHIQDSVIAEEQWSAILKLPEGNEASVGSGASQDSASDGEKKQNTPATPEADAAPDASTDTDA